MDLVRDGTYAAALNWITAQPEVVAADAREGILMFRLAGGMPFFIVEPISSQGPSASEPTTPVNVASASGTTPIRWARPTGTGTAPAPARVVGELTTRDNGQNRKKAIFLTPFAWQGLSMFEEVGPDPIDHLREIPDYSHAPEDVQHIQNGQVTPRAFQGWKDYDAIFVETHGGTLDGHTFIATGIIQEWLPNAPLGEFTRICNALIQPYADLHGIDCGIVPVGEKEYLTVGLLPAFFAQQYSGGLESAIVYIGGCNSAALDDTARILAGSTSAYVGWTGITFFDREPRAAALLVWMLVLHGRGETIEGALKTLANEGLNGGPDFGPNEGGSYMGFFPTGDTEQKQLRLYAVPTLRDPNSTQSEGPGLLDGAELRIKGVVGDAVDDFLEIAVDLYGIIDPENSGASSSGFNDISLSQARDAADLYYLSFYLGEDELDIGRDNLGRMINPTATVIQLGDGRYRYTFTAALGFDVQPDAAAMPLKVVVELPEGGTSDYEVDVTLVGGEALAVITVGGETWRFEGDGLVVCSLSDDGSQLTAGGTVDGALEVWLSAQLTPGGIGTGERLVVGNLARIQVKDGLTHQTWAADPLDSTTAAYAAIPGGSSQIDSLTIEGSHAWGTATFIEMGAVYKAWSDHIPLPSPVTGSFDIECGSGTTIYGF